MTKWIWVCIGVTISMMSAPVALASELSDLKTSASQIKVNTFAEFIKQISGDGFGGIKLAQLERLIKNGESASITQTDPNTGSQLSITVVPASKRATILFYLEGAAYEKLGVDYDTGVLQLSETAARIKQTKPLDASEDAFSVQDVKDEQSMVGWQWRSNNFECRLAMSNADVLGGDLIYECHN